MNSIILQEANSDIVLRALRQADGSITMDIGLDCPCEIGEIINLDEKQIALLWAFLQKSMV